MTADVDREGRVADATVPAADHSPGDPRLDHSPDDQRPGHDPAGRRPLSGRSWPLVVAAALAALAVGVLSTLWFTSTRSSAPTDWGADAGFARDMQTHHNQAVEMSFLVYDRTDDRAVRTLAYDIITSQQQQAGQMYGWLRQWDLPQTGTRPPMAWVGTDHAAGHAGSDGTMPGMATPAQLDELRAAAGVEAERLFLRLMIDHHRGGVAMADAAVAQARTAEVRQLAAAIASAQTSEITLLESMLTERSSSHALSPPGTPGPP